MKLQPASVQEVKRMSLGCAICAVLEFIVFWMLNFFQITHIQFYILVLSIVIGTCIAILNFTMMCLMIQMAVSAEEDRRKGIVRGSYNLRLLVQAVWIVAALLLPCFNIIISAIPLLFPTIVIYFLQMNGKLFPKNSSGNNSVDRNESEEPEEADNLNSFEV